MQRVELESLARAHGFDEVGVAPANLPLSVGRDLEEFIAAGHHGQMEWMARNIPARSSPQTLWAQSQSAIILAHSYAPGFDAMARLAQRDCGVISAYALNQDYHDIIKRKLRQLATQIAQQSGAGVKIFVDTAPVMEKPLAAQSSVGWQGKHTCVVSRRHGSWLFLGIILTTLPLPPDEPEADHCGSCTRCLDICPTNAFIGARKLDARRCISYLTIEHKGHIPLEFRRAMGNRIYGCDDCIAVCPWNKFAHESREVAYHPRDELIAPKLRELALLDDAAFRTLFSKSPVKRIGRDRFVRNVLIAIGNSADTSLTPTAMTLLHDVSELVREAAGWAVQELQSSTRL